MVIHPNDRAAQAAETIHILIDRFPASFAVFARLRKLLKVGIFDSLLMATAGSILLDDLIVALASYTGHFGYLFVCSEEAERIDFIGNSVGAITAKQAFWAAALPNLQHRRRKAEQRVADQESGPRRFSPADLKAAALARRRPRHEPTRHQIRHYLRHG